MPQQEERTAAPDPDPQHLDVVIVGAGMSGIGAAYRLTRADPALTYLILEARDAPGGTWDLFRYPGIRSDSDIWTYAYPFAPWPRQAGAGSVLASGAQLRAYVARTAREAGIEPHVRFGSRVRTACWNSPQQRWTLQATGPDGEPCTYRAGFMLLCTGYFAYDRGHEPEFAGRDDFAGTIVHPQHWPQDLPLHGRRVVVIGSGATAATLVPALADAGAHVVMLQRSPSYLAALPNSDPLARRLRGLPAGLAHRLLRAKNVLFSEVTYAFARLAPQAFARQLRSMLARDLSPQVLDEHFTPDYPPWDQRICRIPEGDLTKAVADGRVEMVTDAIDTFVTRGVRLASGRVLAADTIVTATGLRLLALGGIELTVDGERIEPAQRFAYRGLMLEGVPNLVFTVGYSNASWTLRADLVARYTTRLLAHLRRHGLGVAAPRLLTDSERARPRPLIGLDAGYVRRDGHRLPRQGRRAPWTLRQSYLVESVSVLLARVGRDMRFEKRVTRTAKKLSR